MSSLVQFKFKSLACKTIEEISKETLFFLFLFFTFMTWGCSLLHGQENITDKKIKTKWNIQTRTTEILLPFSFYFHIHFLVLLSSHQTFYPQTNKQRIRSLGIMQYHDISNNYLPDFPDADFPMLISLFLKIWGNLIAFSL